MSLANTYNHKVVARSGGHSYIANGLGGKDGAFVVDLGQFNTVSVNPSTNITTIGSGNRLGNVALALNKSGLAIPHGTCPYVGIGGLSGKDIYDIFVKCIGILKFLFGGHGGYGFTSRKWGLTLDPIVPLDVVIANGDIITANETNYSDLFWVSSCLNNHRTSLS